jgi:hypothetical protein
MPGREEKRERERNATSIISLVHFRFCFPNCYTSRGEKEKKGKTAHFSCDKRSYASVPTLFFQSNKKGEAKKRVTTDKDLMKLVGKKGQMYISAHLKNPASLRNNITPHKIQK